MTLITQPFVWNKQFLPFLRPTGLTQVVWLAIIVWVILAVRDGLGACVRDRQKSGRRERIER